MAKIRIIACPPGEAPQSVREAWIGLELPLAPGRLGRRHVWLSSGVVSGPKTWWQLLISTVRGHAHFHSGYAVNGLEAIATLALKDPIAAAWWRDNATHLLDGKRHLVFPADVCQDTA